MLYPVENEFRRLTCLDGIWDFALDPEDHGVQKEWFKAFPAAHVPMPVPASYNDITTDPAIRDHIGPVWYRKRFHLPSFWRDSTTVLRVAKR